MRQNIFDPYFTTKTYGTGLSLAIVKKIVVEHGGSVNATSSPLGGARVRVMLPVAGTPTAQAVLEAREWQGPPSSARPKSEREPRSQSWTTEASPRRAWATLLAVVGVSLVFGLVVLPRIGPKRASAVEGLPAPGFALEVISAVATATASSFRTWPGRPWCWISGRAGAARVASRRPSSKSLRAPTPPGTSPSWGSTPATNAMTRWPSRRRRNLHR